MTSNILGFVRLEFDKAQGLRSLQTIKSFERGDVVVREKAFADCEVDKDVARLAAYIALPHQLKLEFMRMFTNIELAQRGRTSQDVNVEEFEELAEEANEQAGGSVPALSAADAAEVMFRWDAARHISTIRMYRNISKLIHSCAADVEFRYNIETEMGIVTANGDLKPQTMIGLWLLDDVDVWWKGADMRSEALRNAGFFEKECHCVRCEGADMCRAVKCPNCERGETTRHGCLKRWSCNLCDFNGSDEAVAGFVDLEQQLCRDLRDVSLIDKDELRSWVKHVEARLGLRHWLVAALWKEIHCRQVAKRKEPTFPSTLACLQFLEWIVSRKLSVPPKALVEQLSNMVLSALRFLHGKLPGGVRDLRVVFLRAVDVARSVADAMDRDLLSHIMPFAGAALNIRRMCGFCKALLPEEEISQPEDQSCLTDQDDSGIVDDGIVTRCAWCQELRYCDLGCQKADMKRHRPYCIPAGDTFLSASIARVMVPT